MDNQLGVETSREYGHGRPPDLYAEQMHWDALFADLAAQFDAADAAVSDADVADMARAEAAGILMADRIRAQRDRHLHTRLTGGHQRAGILHEAQPQWIIIADGPRRSLVPMRAIALAWPLAGAAPPASAIAERLSLGHALRALAAAGQPVAVASTTGQDFGRIIRVGADHFDLSTPPGVLTVKWTAVIAVDSHPPGQ